MVRFRPFVGPCLVYGWSSTSSSSLSLRDDNILLQNGSLNILLGSYKRKFITLLRLAGETTKQNVNKIVQIRKF